MQVSLRIALLGLFALGVFGGVSAYGAEATHSSGATSDSPTPSANEGDKTPGEKVKAELEKIQDLAKIDADSAKELTTEQLLKHETKLKKEVKDLAEATSEEDKKKKEQAELELAKIDKILTARTPVLTPKGEISSLGSEGTQTTSTTPSSPAGTPADLSYEDLVQPFPDFGSITTTRTPSTTLGSSMPAQTVSRQQTATVPAKPLNSAPTAQNTQPAVTSQPANTPPPIVTFSNSAPPSSSPSDSSYLEAMKFPTEPPSQPTRNAGGRYEAPAETETARASSAGRALDSSPKAAAPASLSEIASVSGSGSSSAGSASSPNLGEKFSDLPAPVSQPLVVQQGSTPALDSVLAAAQEAKFFNGVGVSAPSSNTASSGRAVAEPTPSESFRESMRSSASTREPLEVSFNEALEQPAYQSESENRPVPVIYKSKQNESLLYGAEEIAEANTQAQLQARAARGATNGPTTNGVPVVKGRTSMKVLTNNANSKEIAGDITQFANALGLN